MWKSPAVRDSLEIQFVVLFGAAMMLSACASAPESGQLHDTVQSAAQASVSVAPNPAEPSWQDVALPGKRRTAYHATRKDGRQAWAAIAERSASMYRRQLSIAPEQLGDVRFSWWVSDLLPGADLSATGQGDSPARVIFAFDGDHEQLSMRNRMLFDLAATLSGERPPYATLMYVWANDAKPESVVINPRTDRIRKIVLESGPRHLRQWRDYQRRIADDYRRAFGEEPGPLIAVAVMTDTDNTSSVTRTWYGDVQFLPSAQLSASAR